MGKGLFGLGKNKREHGVLLLTEDSRLLVLSLPVEVGCVRDDTAQQAWALLSDDCFPQRGTNIPFILASERDVAPIPLDGNNERQGKDSKKLVSQIFKERRKQAHSVSESEFKKDRMADILQTMIYGSGATILGMLLIGLAVNSDRLQWPF